ncbi:MAG: NB-ARC domain-containing protein [Dolichospermum sp.]
MDELVVLLKDWVYSYKGIDLNLDSCEEAILKYSLAGISYSKMSDDIPNYELSTIANIKAPKLFKRLRQVTETDINKKNCKLVLTQLLQQNYQDVFIDKNNYFFPQIQRPHINLHEAPDFSDFYGRSQELNDLQRLIVTENCRVVGVLGMSKIGKTALVRELVENIYRHFDYVFWKSLEYSPELEEILTEIELYFSYNNSETKINNRINHLITHLNQHRCLLIFDKWESVIANNEISKPQAENYVNYEKLLSRIAESKHKSCLIFISIHKPSIMDLLLNRKNINELSLSGLKNQEAKALLTNLGLVEPGIEALIKCCQGHPLALNLAAEMIKNIHNGQITKFLEGTIFMHDAMLGILDKQFSYLLNLERNIIKKLAAEPEPKLTHQIFKYFPSIPQAEIIQAVNKLWQIRLIEKGEMQEYEAFWVLNPLIKKYIKRRYQ